ncbi:MAG TPA: AAA family ATPase [Thermodesulfovibrionales bacterium]|nr:AAA family ATPase [Thermodesulfovibrionales bacterium]
MALKDVIGQERALSIIFGTLRNSRVPSAYLFAGESGIGKKFAAINLAKSVNCLRGAVDYQPLFGSSEKGSETLSGIEEFGGRPVDCCDACASCRKIDSLAHPDLLVIAPEKGEIRVDEIRRVGGALSLKPYEGRRKIVIIDDAHAMNQSAANAFLKTLEEPPEESLLVLVTPHPDKLPETIRSRCSQITFSPLSSDMCEKVIREVHGKHGKRPEVISGLPTMVKLCMGRPGLAFSSDRLKERDRCITLLERMAGGEGEMWVDREEMEQWLDMTCVLLRDMALARITQESTGGHAHSPRSSEEALLNLDVQDFIWGIAAQNALRDIVEVYEKLIALKGVLSFNLNRAVTWNYVSNIIQNLGKLRRTR